MIFKYGCYDLGGLEVEEEYLVEFLEVSGCGVGLEGLEVGLVVLGEVVFCCVGGEEGEVVGGGLGVVCLWVVDGEEEFLDLRGGFRFGVFVIVIVVIVGGVVIVFFWGFIWNIWEVWGIECFCEEWFGRDGNVGFFWDVDCGW